MISKSMWLERTLSITRDYAMLLETSFSIHFIMDEFYRGAKNLEPTSSFSFYKEQENCDARKFYSW